ncbi:MAG: hypothetical protein ACK4TF_00520 [Thermodesulfovibrionales bacterium]
MKRLLFTIIFLVIISSLAYAEEPTIREYPYLYKSPRAMGMGGAYIAIGGRTDAVFYNPATLSNMPEKNFEVNLIGISADIGKNVIDFVSDMGDAFDVGDRDGDGDEGDDQLMAVNDVLAKYRGKNLHLGIADWSSIGRNQGSWALAIGGIARARLDAMTHQGFGSNGLLEINSDLTGGGILGMSIDLGKGFYGGLGIKALHRETLVHSFTAREIVEKQDNLENYITEELRKSGDAIGADLGMLYKFYQDSWLRPSAGLSIMNIGDLKFGAAGKIPMTVNLGASINPEIPVFDSFTFGIDYVDILNNYEQDSDIPKRLRLGGELYLIDRKLMSLGLRTGLYQGYATFGADLRLLLFTVSYVTYAEEVGAYSGQDSDRRHLVFFNIGW